RSARESERAPRRSGASERAEQVCELPGAADDHVRLAAELVRPLVGDDRNPNGEFQAVQPPERLEIGGIVPGVEGATKSAPGEECAYGRALVRVDGRQHLEHLPPPARPEAQLDRAALDLAE